MDQLKELLKRLNEMTDMEFVRGEIEKQLKIVPYEDVLEVEQELLNEGVPLEKMLEVCDLHSSALHGLLKEDKTAGLPAGHPLDTFKKENAALKREIEMVNVLIGQISKLDDTDMAGEIILKIHQHFNNIMDVEKHYWRKEYLLFPILEKYGITGPSTVMWGKDDQIRKMLKDTMDILPGLHYAMAAAAKGAIESHFNPAIAGLQDMFQKEEEILFPMSNSTLTEIDWFEIYKQSDEAGYCLIEVNEKWAPESAGTAEAPERTESSRILLPTGGFTPEELGAVFASMPFDLTFVDKDDNVRFFTEGTDRIFKRSKAILGRKVQFCHPPSSVDVVERILSDFKSGKQNKAEFWINFRGRFVHIAYHALRGRQNEYLGTLEVTQDLTDLRALEGERRILSYDSPKEDGTVHTHPADAGTDAKEQQSSYGQIPGTAAEQGGYAGAEDTKPQREENMDEIKITYDARNDLAAGIHPVNKVLSELDTLSEGEKYLLITPFPPKPLIAKAAEKGFSAEEKYISDTEYHTVFYKNK